MKNSALLIFLIAMGTAVFAQQYNFTNGGGDNLWNNPDNWDQGSVPNSIDHTVWIGTSSVTYDVKVPANALCGYLLLRDGSSLVVRDGATLTISFPESGPDGVNAQIETSATLTVEVGGKLEYDGAIIQGGTLIVNGTVDLLPPSPAR